MILPVDTPRIGTVYVFQRIPGDGTSWQLRVVLRHVRGDETWNIASRCYLGIGGCHSWCSRDDHEHLVAVNTWLRWKNEGSLAVVMEP